MDNLPRALDILGLIPKHPNSISTSELLKKLDARGHNQLKLRTLQRDLEKISAAKIPISSSENTKPLRWFWTESSKRLQFPAISVEEAVAFKLVETFLDKLLPPVIKNPIADCFQFADEKLKSSPLASWIEKVRIVPNNLSLVNPDVSPSVLNVIYESLFNNYCFSADYKPLEREPRHYIVNPLGLVFRHNVTYLIATTPEHPSPKQFALHRFKNVEITDVPVIIPKNFSLEQYVSEGAFDYPIGDDFKLKLIIKDYMRGILMETPLSTDQIITEYDGKLFLLSATVKNTRQLNWWIHSFATGIVILEPPELRKEFMNELNELKELYQKIPSLD
jgi:predicted DNA-binding transcriptional regulator YafY